MEKYSNIFISIILTLFASNACAQEVRINIHNIDSHSFSVHVSGSPGSTVDEAGTEAMNAACREARSRSSPYVGVFGYSSSLETARVLTQQGSVQYHGGTDGRAVGATRTDDQYQNVTYGKIILTAQLLGESSVTGSNNFTNVMQIIDVQTCRLIN